MRKGWLPAHSCCHPQPRHPNVTPGRQHPPGQARGGEAEKCIAWRASGKHQPSALAPAPWRCCFGPRAAAGRQLLWHGEAQLSSAPSGISLRPQPCAGLHLHRPAPRVQPWARSPAKRFSRDTAGTAGLLSAAPLPSPIATLLHPSPAPPSPRQIEGRTQQHTHPTFLHPAPPHLRRKSFVIS